MTPLPASTDTAAAPLLLLHGLGFSARYWQRQMPALGTERRLLGWTMPGHGGTAPLPGMTFAALSGRLVRFLDQSGAEKADILGHSMGGMLALDFAARHPDRVRSLMLFGASAAFPPPESDFAKNFIAETLAPLESGGTMADVASATIARHIAPDADPEAAGLIRACLAETTPAAFRQTLACLATFDRRASLGGLAMPTLVLAARNDLNAPAAGVEKMAAKIPGARYHCLEAAGHFAHLERPEAFTAAITEFLASLKA